jgi:hypothetical protein
VNLLILFVNWRFFELRSPKSSFRKNNSKSSRKRVIQAFPNQISWKTITVVALSALAVVGLVALAAMRSIAPSHIQSEIFYEVSHYSNLPYSALPASAKNSCHHLFQTGIAREAMATFSADENLLSWLP